MKQIIHGLGYVCVFLVVSTILCSPVLNAQLNCSAKVDAASRNPMVPPQILPRPPPNTTSNVFSMGPNGQQVNVYSGYTHEPAPMGIADYGIGPNGAYQYTTSSFVGIITINSLTTRTSSNDPSMGIQLNVNLAFTCNGKQYVYWVQDVVCLNTATNTVNYFCNNIWNSSAPSAGMSSLGIVGNGQVYNSQYYGVCASPSLPGSTAALQYPATITLNVTCGINFGGQPTVSFAYDDGYGMITYDTVAFITSYPISSFSGFVVNGYNYNPTNYLFYDSELILGGPGDGANTQLITSNTLLQLEYWNGHNYQMVDNAYNFGSDTAEGISNTLSQTYYYPSTGMIIAMVQPGAGSLGKLYDQSTVGIIDFKSAIAAGVLYITNATSKDMDPWQIPFINSEVIVTLIPGCYNLQLYQNGLLLESVNCTVTAGQTLSSQLTSITLFPCMGSTSLNSTNCFIVSFTLGGQPQIAHAQNGTLIISADTDSNVYITGTSTGSSSTEEWVLNGFNDSGTVAAGSSASYCYYDLLSQQVAYFAATNSINTYVTYMTAPSFFWGQTTIPAPATVTSLLPYFWQQVIFVQKGTTLTVNNTIAGTAQDRWATPIYSWAITQTNQIDVDIFYYHQYQAIVNYATADNSLPSSAPLLIGTQFGSSYQAPIISSNQIVWLDENTQWSVTNVTAFLPHPSQPTPNPTPTPPKSPPNLSIFSPDNSTYTQGSSIPLTLVYDNNVVDSTYGFPVFWNVMNDATGDWVFTAGGMGIGMPDEPYNVTGYPSSFNIDLNTYGGQSLPVGEYTIYAYAGNQYGLTGPITLTFTVTAPTEQWVCSAGNTGTITQATSITPTYDHQYSLAVTSPYGSTSGSGWYNAGSTAYAALASGTVVEGTGIQYLFSSWSTGGTNYQQSSAITMNSAITATANWNTQYYLTITSAYGSPSGNGWYNSGTTANFGINSPISGGTGMQYVFTSWTGSGSGAYNGNTANSTCIMNAPITESATWTTQYYLTVSSSYGSPIGAGWYNAGAPATFNVTTPFSGGTGIQYLLNSWTGSGIGSYSGSATSGSLTMNNAVTEAASWTTQYYLTVNNGGYGTVSGSGWYNSGSTVQASDANNVVPGSAGTQYIFAGWAGDASGSGSTSDVITMNSAKTATASWTTQYQVSFAVTPSGSATTNPAGTNSWINAGPLSISISPNSGYTFSQWTASGDSITFDNSNSMFTTANVNGPGIITAILTANPTPTSNPSTSPSAPTVPPATPTSTPTDNPTALPSKTPNAPEFPSVTLIAILMAGVAGTMLYLRRKQQRRF